MELEAPITTIMTSNVICVEPNQKLIDLKHIYENPSFHSHVPVTVNDRLIGIVSLINFMRAIHNASLDDDETVYHAMTVEDIMTPNPVTVLPSATIREVARELAKGEFHSIIIADNREVMGIVTTTDILRKLIKD